MVAYLKSCLMSSLLIFISTSTFALAPFKATYQFAYNGKTMGTATRQLSQQNQQWTYKFSANVLGIASAYEISHFTLNNGQIYSQSFMRTSKILKHHRTRKINFDPKAKLITTQDKTNRSFAWQMGVLDELNAELQVREDLKKKSLKSHYLIADAKGVENRKFIQQGSEQIKIDATHTYNTIKIVIQHQKPNRQTIFWLAPQLDYLPVQVFHQDEDTSYRLTLIQYSP